MADVKISALPAASALSGPELFEAVQGGANVKVTATQLATFTGGGGGSGTVTSFSAGNLSPLFTTNVANPTTTPALTFALSSQSANTVFAGPTGGGATAPTFRALVAADIPDVSSVYVPVSRTLTINGSAQDLSANRTWTITVTGTSNRISVTGGTGLNPTIDIDAAYVGQASITTLGTITTGVWNGTVIVTTYGGTGLSSYTQGDLLYYDAGTLLSKLAKNTSATRYLSNTGTSNNPAWAQVDLTNGVTGVLPIANGGTGSTGGAWLLASGGTLTNTNNVTANLASRLIFDGTWTGTASLQFANSFASTITGRAAADTYYGTQFMHSMTAGANATRLYAVWIQPTMATGGFSNTLRVPLGIVVPSNLSDGVAIKIYRNDATTEIFTFGADASITMGGVNIGPATNGAGAFNGTGSVIVPVLSSSNNQAFTVNPQTTTNGTTAKVNIRATNTSYTVSTGTGSFAQFKADPTYNITGGTQTVYGFWYAPTEMSMTGTTHYGLIINTTTALSGFATATPVSTLETARSFGANVTNTNADITLDTSHFTVTVDASGANRTITLPTAASSTRRIYIIKKTDSSINTVTVDGNGAETIDGATTYVIALQYSLVAIQSNGTSWLIIFSM